jgi:PAS domain S-box-containing protein
MLEHRGRRADTIGVGEPAGGWFGRGSAAAGSPDGHGAAGEHPDRAAGEHAHRLALSEARYRDLIDHLRESAVFVFDRELRYVMAAGPALAATGVDGSQLVGRKASDEIDPAEYRLIGPLLAKGLCGTASSIEYRSTRDGRIYLIDVTPLGTERDGVESLQVVARDMTELRQSEERFRVLAEAATEGVCIIEEGHVVNANAALATMCGYDPADLVGMAVEDFLTPEIRDEVRDSVPVDEFRERVHTGVRKDGTRFPVLATGRPVSYQGRMMRVATVTDLSDQARVAALDERRRVARDLHDGLAHELAFIASKASALRRRIDPSGDIDELVTASERALDEARRAISVLSSTQHEPLGAALAHTAEDLAARHSMVLRLAVDPDMDASPDVVENVLRIVREAVINAARHGHAPSITLRGWRDDALHVVVEDDGGGFDPDAVTRGFGLVSMRERAAALRGSLDLRSAPGRGTRVEVMLP